MRHGGKYRQLFLLVLAAPVWATSAETGPGSAQEQRRDPFQLPGMAAAKPLISAMAAVSEPPPAEAEPASVWQPRLRAILHDAAAPLVNIDGQIIGIGESLQGYRLQQVSESEAVLVKGARRMILSIDGGPAQ
jgi:hypothetical protein